MNPTQLSDQLDKKKSVNSSPKKTSIAGCGIMPSTFKKLFLILSKKQKRDLLILQFLMLITSIAELVGIASILPFMSVAAAPELIETNPALNTV